MKFRNIVISLLFLILLEVANGFNFLGVAFWWFFGASIFILIISILWALGLPFKKWFSVEVFGHSAYLVLPVLFYASSAFFILFIQGPISKQLFIIGSSILFLIILTGIRGIILNLGNAVKPRLTYNILILSTILTSFLAYSVVWAFFRDLSPSIWSILLIFFFLTTLLFYQIFHLFGVLRNRSVIYASFSALALTQIAWIICLRPIEYFFSGILLTIVFYTFWGLIHHQLEDSLTKMLVAEYVTLSLIIFFIILRSSLGY